MKLGAVFSKIKLVNLSRLLKKMERAQIHKIRDDKEVTTEIAERSAKDHKRLLLYDDKFDNLEEMYR